MAGNDVAPTTTWEVIGVNPTVDISSGGVPVKGNQVTYVTGLGHRGNTFVADTVPVPDGVKAVIRAAATRTDALATLSE